MSLFLSFCFVLYFNSRYRFTIVRKLHFKSPFMLTFFIQIQSPNAKNKIERLEFFISNRFAHA